MLLLEGARKSCWNHISQFSKLTNKRFKPTTHRIHKWLNIFCFKGGALLRNKGLPAQVSLCEVCMFYHRVGGGFSRLPASEPVTIGMVFSALLSLLNTVEGDTGHASGEEVACGSFWTSSSVF